jgi:hypothetical protein
MKFSRLIALAVLVTLLDLAGCASPQSRQPAPVIEPGSPMLPGETSSPFPPRPAELRIDGINPCNLLTPNQTTSLRVSVFEGYPKPVAPGVMQCSWIGNGFTLKNWIAQLISNRGITPTISSAAAVQTIQIDGFTTLQGSSPLSDGKSDCVQLIDIAQGQSLLASYNDPELTKDGIDHHQLTCEMDSKFSTEVIQNLRTMTHTGG